MATAIKAQAVKLLCDFFEREIPKLPESYQWRIPSIEGFSGSGESGYLVNMELKRFLHEQWWVAEDEDRRFELAHTIVSDWGGVRANRPETLKKYVRAIAEPTPRTRLQGVASYSKIFAIVHPEQYAIYDARVAACLNAVQLNAGLGKGLAFNYVSGRNKVVGYSGKKIGFTQTPRFSVGALCEDGWSRIKRDDTYGAYSALLTTCLNELQKTSRDELEMALFAKAEDECQQAMARG